MSGKQSSDHRDKTGKNKISSVTTQPMSLMFAQQDELLSTKHEILMEDHESLKKDYASLEIRFKHVQEMNETMKSHFQNQNPNKELEEMNRSLIKDLEKERSEKEECKKIIEEMKSVESEKKAMNLRLLKDLEKERSEKEEHKKRLESERKASTELEVRNLSLVKGVESERSEKDKYKKIVEKMKRVESKRKAMFDDDLESERSEKEQYKKIIEEMKREESERKSMIDDLKSKNEELIVALENEEEVHKKNEDKYNELAERFSNVEKECSYLKSLYDVERRKAVTLTKEVVLIDEDHHNHHHNKNNIVTDTIMISDDDDNPPREDIIMKQEEEECDNRINSPQVNYQSTKDSDDCAIKPLDMYFPPTEYTKKIKISTRCYIADVLKTLEELDPPMNMLEKSYFDNHRQFKHIFHMPKDGTHKVMGMWMLLLRTARIQKEKEVWFVVNGCPIRYGIKEHALISGLNCRNYPLNYKKAGGMNFVKKYFGTGIVRYQDVKAKVQEGMQPSCDRLRLLVLYFLSSIIVGQRKTGKDAPSVDEFLLRAVDDLNLCSTFPWGRLSFDYMLKQISHTMTHFGGNVKEDVIWPIPGFCIPMELLAFEAIKKLGASFRESVEDVDPTCPRMCQSKFKRSEMKGFQLSKINKELGNTKDIENILTVSKEEQTLLDRITEPEDTIDKDDVIVESWMKRFYCGDVVRFEDMLEEDVAAREALPPDNGGTETGATNEGAEMTVKLNELVELFNSFKEDMGERMKKIEEKVGEFDSRFTALEAYVQE